MGWKGPHTAARWSGVKWGANPGKGIGRKGSVGGRGLQWKRREVQGKEVQGSEEPAGAGSDGTGLEGKKEVGTRAVKNGRCSEHRSQTVWTSTSDSGSGSQTSPRRPP